MHLHGCPFRYRPTAFATCNCKTALDELAKQAMDRLEAKQEITLNTLLVGEFSNKLAIEINKLELRKEWSLADFERVEALIALYLRRYMQLVMTKIEEIF